MPNPHALRRLVFCWLVLLIGWLAPQGAVGGDAVESDLWYVIEMAGKRSGYAHIQSEVRDGRLVTLNNTHMEMRRGQMAVTIESNVEWVETPDHKPVSSKVTTRFGAMAITQELRFTETGRELVSTQAGPARTTNLPPVQGEWMTPGRMAEYFAEQLEAGAKEIKVRTIDLSLGPEPQVMTFKVLGRENIEVFGKVTSAIATEMTLSSMPALVTKQFVDEHGNALKATVNMGPGVNFTMLLADKDLAMSKLDPPELMAATLVRPEGKINQPRDTRQAIYELSYGDGKAIDIDLPSAASQRVVWGDRRTARVVVDLDSPVAAGRDLPGKEALAATTMLDHTDAVVRELVARALKGKEDASKPEQAEAIRGFVRRYLTVKDLSVAFGTASEVARTRAGDCTEHAVLLAAMLRGAGIPSRTVTGLIYVDQFLGKRQVFGYHMWAQAWLDGESGAHWVDLDATLPARGFDAAHIALSTSLMTDRAMTNDLVELVPVLGRLEVKVISAE